MTAGRSLDEALAGLLFALRVFDLGLGLSVPGAFSCGVPGLRLARRLAFCFARSFSSSRTPKNFLTLSQNVISSGAGFLGPRRPFWFRLRELFPLRFPPFWVLRLRLLLRRRLGWPELCLLLCSDIVLSLGVS